MREAGASVKELDNYLLDVGTDTHTHMAEQVTGPSELTFKAA